jgi:8-oxo-dGTP pyrophosphatase MutT (NUDIX family)
MKKLLTLCLVCRDNEILLGMKKRGFGEGRWNGFGGKVETGETIETAAIRELGEEAGLVPKSIEKVGVIDFTFQSDPKVLEVSVFRVTDFVGEPVETEMRPRWFKITEIPYSQMWKDDEVWLPLLLQGKKFRASFVFDKPASSDYAGKIISQSLKEVDSL